MGTTDGGARPDKGDRTTYSTNLLGHSVREKQVRSLEEAVYRMTSKTGLIHDLHDRGFIAVGKPADITIFDPDTIASEPREPMYSFPGGEMHVKQGAVGINYVIVNGEVLLEDGEHPGALPCQVLKTPVPRGPLLSCPGLREYRYPIPWSKLTRPPGWPPPGMPYPGGLGV